MKRFIFAFYLVVAAGMIFAQQEVGEADPYMIGLDSAQQMLKEVSVDKFELDGFWSSRMSSDDGYTTSRLFSGAPAAKEPIPDEEGMDIPDEYVLGTRVDYLRRGYHSFFIRAARPIPIEGITKTVSVWVVGRNFNHEMSLLIQDFFGRNYEIYMGRLNFQGWKKLTVAIPPQTGSVNGVTQRSYHFNNQMGIRIVGFRIDCDPMETLGSYYLYLDDLRAVTDLFAENDRDADDMSDGW
ncbi:MAG: flagellar filament outer layer protein FlaA [Treponema sp.]|jgi:hypothetical protein|nr:flagellar filament outer layer protein FlaA [Treponema sp.]